MVDHARKREGLLPCRRRRGRQGDRATVQDLDPLLWPGLRGDAPPFSLGGDEDHQLGKAVSDGGDTAGHGRDDAVRGQPEVHGNAHGEGGCAVMRHEGVGAGLLADEVACRSRRAWTAAG